MAGRLGHMREVRLRDWVAGDAAAIAPVLEDPEVLKWSHIAEVGSERWIAEQRAGRRGPSMAICALDDGQVLGRSRCGCRVERPPRRPARRSVLRIIRSAS